MWEYHRACLYVYAVIVYFLSNVQQLCVKRFLVSKAATSCSCSSFYRDSKPVVRDPNFRLFCCMNPATDVGKKQLPFIIRNR